MTRKKGIKIIENKIKKFVGKKGQTEQPHIWMQLPISPAALSHRWDQKDIDGKQVQAGTYNAKTSSAIDENSNNTSPIAVSTTFTIK